MRSKIRYDGESYKIFKTLKQLNSVSRIRGGLADSGGGEVRWGRQVAAQQQTFATAARHGATARLGTGIQYSRRVVEWSIVQPYREEKDDSSRPLARSSARPLARSLSGAAHVTDATRGPQMTRPIVYSVLILTAPSVQKNIQLRLRVNKNSLDLTKFLVNTIHIYDSKLIY
jgi:hypothetical protein